MPEKSSVADNQENQGLKTTAEHSLKTTSAALKQYEVEKDQLVRARTELECMIADYEEAGTSGEEKRAKIAEELEQLEKTIEESAGKLIDLGTELDDRTAAEKEAKES
jgi:structural maintenance of chromosome 3 (chondroitin sulfate proteoglycan 6)